MFDHIHVNGTYLHNDTHYQTSHVKCNEGRTGEKVGSFEVLHVLRYVYYALYVRWKFELIVYGETDS